MSNVAILWEKPSDRCSLSGGSWAAGLPLANIKNTDIKRVARTTNAAPSSTRFRLDFGSESLPVWSMFVLLAHNITTSGKVRVVVTSDATDSDPGARVMDTGLTPAWEPTVVWGTLPWGAFPWDGVDTEAYPGGALWFYLNPEPVYGRYVWVYVEDVGNPNGYIDIGRFLAGQAWSPARNINFGAQINWIDPSPVRRSRYGRRFSEELPKYRTVDMQFGLLTQAEAIGASFDILRKVGKTGDLFYVEDPQADPSLRFRTSVYASLVENSPITNEFHDGFTWRLSLEEIV